MTVADESRSQGQSRPRRGPDIVLAGAARCGTTYLAARLAENVRIDPGAVKEPNYYSRYLDRGHAWYEALYSQSSAELIRLDASVSYTYPQHGEALGRVTADSPQALGVYIVREPLERAVSHYLYYRHYFKMEPAESFAAAIRARSWYLDVSDYLRWFRAFDEAFAPGRRIVVPFQLVRAHPDDVTAFICRAVGIDAEQRLRSQGAGHRNDVVEYRSDLARRAVGAVRRSRVYPAVRRALGADRVRSIRGGLTRRPTMPTTAEALASCDTGQRARLDEFASRVRSCVADRLAAQDAEHGTDWSPYWEAAVDDGPPPRAAH